MKTYMRIQMDLQSPRSGVSLRTARRITLERLLPTMNEQVSVQVSLGSKLYITDFAHKLFDSSLEVRDERLT